MAKAVCWVVLIQVAFLVLAPPSDAAHRYGFNADAAEWESHMDDAVAARANLARVPLHFERAAELDGARDLLHIDRIYSRAKRHGIRLQIALWGIDPPDPADYAQAAARVARRYPDAWIELWNEPQLEKFGGLSVNEAAALSRAAAKAIHKINPNQKIIGPGVLTFGWERYVAGVYARLPKYVNLGVHLYPGPRRPLHTLSTEIRTWRKRLGRPVDVTEIGMRAIYFRGRQARMSSKAYRELVRAGARSVTFHSLARGQGPPSEWELQGRLWAIDADGKRTRLFRSLRRAWR